MHGKCSALQKKRALCDAPTRNIVALWNALILRYNVHKQGQDVLECFERMQQESVLANEVTYSCVLKACAMISAIEKGKQIHSEISSQGLLEDNIVLGGALVDMYSKSGALPLAQSAVEKLPSHNIVVWTALIAGYAQSGRGHKALECFEEMQFEGISPNAVTYMSVLKACAESRLVEKGKKIHDDILSQGLLDHNKVLGCAIVDMYAKCGALSQAQSALEKLPSRDVVTWNALIAGFVEKGLGQGALDCLKKMESENIPPNSVTYLCILKACTFIGSIDLGKRIHDEISDTGMLDHDLVLGAALVDMYAKCGDLCKAQSVLQKLPYRDVVLWNILICGYTQMGQGEKALQCYENMQRDGISPTVVTYVSCLKACAMIGSIDKGKQIHDDLSRQGLLEDDVIPGNALVDMYARCGAFHQAQSVIWKLPCRNVVTWSTLIAGYAQKGLGQQALKAFDQMVDEGIAPDIVTFKCLLNLCNRLGMVEKGRELIDMMGWDYNLKPDLECFASVVDLLGRAGHLGKAMKLIQEMNCMNKAVWHCLLRACCKWIDAEMGIWAFRQAVELDIYDESAYDLTAKICSAAGMPARAKDFEIMMQMRKVIN